MASGRGGARSGAARELHAVRQRGLFIFNLLVLFLFIFASVFSASPAPIPTTATTARRTPSVLINTPRMMYSRNYLVAFSPILLLTHHYLLTH